MRGPFVNYKKHWQWEGKWFDEITLGAFLDIVRPLSLKRATVIPVTNSVQLLATHLGCGLGRIFGRKCGL